MAERIQLTEEFKNRFKELGERDAELLRGKQRIENDAKTLFLDIQDHYGIKEFGNLEFDRNTQEVVVYSKKEHIEKAKEMMGGKPGSIQIDPLRGSRMPMMTKKKSLWNRITGK